jgi:hypothetical protein
MRRWIMPSSVAGVLLALVPAAPAMAVPLSCGDTILVSSTLTTDLTCTGDGLIIGAAGVTLDLGGHTISGTGTGVGIRDTGPASFSNVTVRDGTVRGFATQAMLDSVHDVTFQDIRLAGPGVGLDMLLAQDVHFVDGALTDAPVHATSSAHTVLTGSTVTNSAIILVVSSNFSEITDSSLVDSRVVLDQVDFTLVADSTLTRSPVDSHGVSRNGTFRNNRFGDADVGLTLSDVATGTQIIQNTFSDNRIGVNIQTTGPLTDLNGIDISTNRFLGNRAAGALVEATTPSSPANATIQANMFLNNGLDPGGLLDHLGNPVADGLHIAVPAGGNILVGLNKTVHNGSFGIFAVPGTVVDAGGNTSAANPNGCLGVVCT